MGSVRRIAPAADDVTLGGAVDAYLATLFGDRAVFSGGEVGFNDAMFSASRFRLNDAMFSSRSGLNDAMFFTARFASTTPCSPPARRLNDAMFSAGT